MTQNSAALQIPDRAKLLYVLDSGGKSAMARAAAEMGFSPRPQRRKKESRRQEPDPEASPSAPARTVDTEPTMLEPVRFWLPTRREYRETLEGQPLPPRPASMEDPIEWEDVEPDPDDEPLPHGALCAWPRLWRVLEDQLRTPRPRRQVDVARLVRRVARGGSVRSIPRRQGLAHAPVLVLLDLNDRLAPIRRDQLDVLQRLIRRLGRKRVRAVEAEALLGGKIPSLGAEERVLALTDLGSYASDQERGAWMRLGAQLLQILQHPPVALVAAPPRLWPRRAVRLWQAVEWEHPGGESLRAGEPETGAQQEPEEILVGVSAAQRIELGWMRSIRRRFGGDISAEMAILRHPDVVSYSPGHLKLRPSAAMRWRRAFHRLPPEEKAALARLLSTRHQRLPEIRAAEMADLLACGLPESALDPAVVEEAWAILAKICRRVSRKEVADRPLDVSADAWFSRLSQWCSLELWHAPQVRGDLEQALRAFQARYPSAAAATGTTPEALAKEQTDLGELEGMDVVQADGMGAASSGVLAGSLLAQVTTRGGSVWMSDGLAPAQELGALLSQHRPMCDGTVHITTNVETVSLEAWQPNLSDATSWACAAGRDRFGLWAAFEVEGVRQRLRWIPPGRFWMGSPATEPGRQYNEGPQHAVTLEQGFWLADTPCTQELWEAVMGDNPSKFKGKQRPVELVSWNDTQEFLERLNRRFRNLEARLPTEAEWEYGCRAGTQGAHWLSGPAISESESAQRLQEIAWFTGNSEGSTQSVASKSPNPWGLYDSLGNVLEWCWDWYEQYSETLAIDPEGPEGGGGRVIRGGSWSEHAQDVRAAYRFWGRPDVRSPNLGFRLSRGRVPKLRGAENKVPRASSEQARRGTSLRAGARRSMAWIEWVRWANDGGVDPYGRWAVFSANGVEQRMRWIVPGRFRMGSPEDEAGRWEDEGPQHEVELSQGFWLADTPCTQALWEAVMGANPSRFLSPRRPVENVSWEAVQEFLTRLGSEVPGLEPEIPTEAQWEYACRVGTRTATWQGDLEILGERHAPGLDSIAWYGGNSGVGFELPEGEDSSGWKEVQFPRQISGSRDVAQKQANPWGLYDMLGNVFEWCRDGERAYQPDAVLDPVGPEGSQRVFRGGSWGEHARSVRAADRSWGHPDGRIPDLGFRLSRGPQS